MSRIHDNCEPTPDRIHWNIVPFGWKVAPNGTLTPASVEEMEEERRGLYGVPGAPKPRGVIHYKSGRRR